MEPSRLERIRAANEMAKSLQVRGKTAKEIAKGTQETRAAKPIKETYAKLNNPIGAESDAEAVQAGREAADYLKQLNQEENQN